MFPSFFMCRYILIFSHLILEIRMVVRIFFLRTDKLKRNMCKIYKKYISDLCAI